MLKVKNLTHLSKKKLKKGGNFDHVCKKNRALLDVFWYHPWVWDKVTSGQLFTVRGDVLQRGLVGSRGREMDVMLIVSLWSLTGIPAALPRCQSDFRVIWRNLNPSLADSRPRGVLGWGVGRPLLVNGGSRVGSDLLRWAQCCVHWSLG